MIIVAIYISYLYKIEFLEIEKYSNLFARTFIFNNKNQLYSFVFVIDNEFLKIV